MNQDCKSVIDRRTASLSECWVLWSVYTGLKDLWYDSKTAGRVFSQSQCFFKNCVSVMESHNLVGWSSPCLLPGFFWGGF